ncbi:Uncharacterised protein [Chryseobacterium nakagawai]|nr:Uncharacterised protein [Chryseobacterium nakagawai]
MIVQTSMNFIFQNYKEDHPDEMDKTSKEMDFREAKSLAF